MLYLLWARMVPNSVGHTCGPLHIRVNEPPPIIVAIAIWGKKWLGLTIQANCDNVSVVNWIRSKESRDLVIVHYSGA